MTAFIFTSACIVYTPSTPDRLGEWIGRIRGNTDTERHANALLISKAPEMLEMLKALVNGYDLIDLGDTKVVLEAKQLIKSATEINE